MSQNRVISRFGGLPICAPAPDSSDQLNPELAVQHRMKVHSSSRSNNLSLVHRHQYGRATRDVIAGQCDDAR